MIKDLESYKLVALKEIAKKLGITRISSYKKNDLIEAIKRKEKEKQEKDDGKEVVEAVLEVIENKDFGFLRFENFSPSPQDVYVSPQQIKKLNLKTGDLIKGIVRENKEQDKFRALIYINEVNSKPPLESIRRKSFNTLVPIHPNERLYLTSNKSDYSTRFVDLFAPVGKGQRGLIVAPPKAGKTVLLKSIAKSIEKNNPECYIMVLLIDERPEEVTDMKRSIKSEVISSTFDEPPSNHIRVAEMVLERARAMSEMGTDVVILLDSITRLARAYNLETTPSGRTLSGGLDPSALHKPKRFLGTARKLEGAGSVTILATALIETGSRMDDVIFEEFKGTGNMELVLSRELSEMRLFPAIDISKSGTRMEELLLKQNELTFIWSLRRALKNSDTATMLEELMNGMTFHESNDEFINWAKKNIRL